MKLLDNLAIKLGITKAEMTAVTLLAFFLLLGGALKYSGAVQQADKAIEQAEAARFSEADVDSLLALALQEKESAGKTATPAAAQTPRLVASQAKSEPPAPKPSPSHAPQTKHTGPIAFSSATSAQLQRIPGVGPVMARRLIEFRQRKGGAVTQFNDFLEVKGIGKKKLETLKKHLELE